MSRNTSSFFITGGTVPRDAPCYIRRQADDDLVQSLQHREFCYVLTARQMGKSSLMVHAATHLRQEGVTVALLDLTAIGQNLSPSQWYRGLLGRLGRQLDLEDELEASWEANEGLGGMQRWTETLGDVLLKRCPGPVVLFVDEIDAVRSLPFSADEFFAAIRECHNRRADNPDYRRLTFCLLGVATPSELIQDPHRTPFNIGQRIELNDFSLDEIMALSPGFIESEIPPHSVRRILQRIHYWTSGHPYLTQRLCRSAVDAKATRPEQIDRLCAALFFGRATHERNDNLLFVQDRLLRSSHDTAAILDLYQQVLAGKRCVAGASGPFEEPLRLSGVVCSDPQCRLRPRNRIYRQVFDHQWIRAHLPNAEKRRQQAAFQRGLVRALGISSVVLLAIISFGYRIVASERRAVRAEKAARSQLFVSDMNLAQQALEENHVARALQLLTAHGGDPEETNRFDWRLLWAQCHDDDGRFSEPAGGALALCFAPQGDALLSASATDLSIGRWPLGKGEKPARIPGITLKNDTSDQPLSAAFSTDGALMARAHGKSCELVSLATGTARKLPTTDGDFMVAPPAFSQDGRTLVTGDYSGTIRLWDVATGRLWRKLCLPGFRIAALALSRDKRMLAVTGFDGTIALWPLDSPRPLHRFQGHPKIIRGLRFSPDGSALATGGQDGITRIWSVTSGTLLQTLRGHSSQVMALEFSPDGRLLATGSADQTIRIWSTRSWETRRVLHGHTGRITALAFSSDGNRLATGSTDAVTSVWNIQASSHMFRFVPDGVGIRCAAALPPDGSNLLLIDQKDNLHLQNAISGSHRQIPLAPHPSEGALSVSPDGRRFVTANDEGEATIRDAISGRSLLHVSGHGSVVGTALSSGDRYLAIGSSNGTIWLRDGTAGRLLRQIALPGRGGAATLSFSPDGGRLAVGALFDGSVHVLEVPSLRTLSVLNGHTGAVMALTFSPDGRLLATGGNDATIRLWPLGDNGSAPSRALEGHAGFVDALAFSPDGRTLASGGSDGITHLWDVQTARETVTIASPDVSDTVISLLFDPEGRHLIALYQNGLAIRRTAGTASSQLTSKE